MTGPRPWLTDRLRPWTHQPGRQGAPPTFNPRPADVTNRRSLAASGTLTCPAHHRTVCVADDRPAEIASRLSPPTRLARPPRWSRQLAVVAMALAFSLALSGCSWLSPASTSFPQIHADGVPLRIGGIEFENLVVVASSRGTRGVLTGQTVNTTRHPIDVTVSVKGGGTGTVHSRPDGG